MGAARWEGNEGFSEEETFPGEHINVCMEMEKKMDLFLYNKPEENILTKQPPALWLVRLLDSSCWFLLQFQFLQ